MQCSTRTTQVILKNVRDILAEYESSQDYTDNLAGMSLQGLDTYIATVCREWPSWGDIVFSYLMEQKVTPENGSAYTDEECRHYYQLLTEAFRRNHVAGRDKRCLGSLEIGTSSRLDSAWMRKPISEYFNTPSYQISRAYALLYSFGLNLPYTDASELLKKVILQQDFDITDYKEAIYAYCLKFRGLFTSPYDEMVRLMKVYDAMEKPDALERKTSQYTQFFRKEFDEIRSREEMLAYLRYLKGTGYRSVYAKEWFFADINALPFVIDQKIELKIRKKGAESLSDLAYQMVEPLSCELIANSIGEERKKAFQRMKEYHLPEKGLLQKLFSDRRQGSGKNTLITFSKNYIYDRLEGIQNPTRKDILILKFLQYTYELEFFSGDGLTNEDDYNPKSFVDGALEMEEDALEKGMNFKQNLDNELTDARMQELYLRDPFELFLFRCVMDHYPWSYFMACWYKGAEACD